MSKTGKHLSKFIVGSLLLATMMTPVFSQSVDDETITETQEVVGNPIFTETVREADTRRRSINNLGSDDARRNQLLGLNDPIDIDTLTQPQVPTPIPAPTNAQQNAQPALAATPITNPTDPNGSTLANIAAAPVQTGTPVAPAADPFAATGLRLGTYDVNVSLEQAIGYSSNVSQQVDGDSGAFSDTSVVASITSDWSRHQWQTNINGNYRRPFDDEEIDTPQLLINTALRLDLIDGYTLTTNGFYNITTQGFTSSTLAPGAIDNPIVENFGGGVELQRTNRKLQLTLTGDIDRAEFESSDLGGGIIQDESDQNNTEYRLTARVGYEISPAITPFFEGSYAVRGFDQESDRNGNDRDSDLFELRGGVEIDLGEKLNGEIAVGYVNESFDDPLLEDLDAVTINGQLNWSPERDTQVLLTLGTTTNNSITANDNGSIIYNGRLDIDRQITDRLSVNAFADATFETNIDNNQTFNVGVGTQYWVNRFVAITSQVDFQRFESDAPNSSFDATSGQIGILLQR